MRPVGWKQISAVLLHNSGKIAVYRKTSYKVKVNFIDIDIKGNVCL